MLRALQNVVRLFVDAHGDLHGFAVTPIQGVGMMRAYAPTRIARSIYKPLVCLILQGAKQVTVGGETHIFAAGTSAIVSADVPVVSRIIAASRAEPYLAVAIELDLGVLRDLAVEIGGSDTACMQPPAVLLDNTDAYAADCISRLVKLVERPEAIPMLRSSIVREFHYWLLTGRHGRAIRGLASTDGVPQRIARAIIVLRRGFDRTLRIDDLAADVGMSLSSFHQHFRATTSLSPLQFQKQLRLVEARRLMVSDGLSSSQAAFKVGYESVTQFTREYGRLFGLPPGRDASASRAA